MFCHFPFSGLTQDTLHVYFKFFHNSQWKIGSDLSLYRQADTYKAHTSMSFPSFKGNDFYFFEEKNTINAQLQK